MKVLITGAGGFIGQDLATALLQSDHALHLTITDIETPPIPRESSLFENRIKQIAVDLTNSDQTSSLLEQKFDVYYLLHGIMSGESEANIELGYKVNIDSHRFILDYLRRNQPGAKVIFSSSLAIFGPAGPGQVVSEKTVPLPQSSYGTQKYIIETLVNDYSRKGLIDGRNVRLPTVVVRPGKPSSGVSSFASGIVRESLRGQKNVLPVRRELEMWIGSPDIVVKNLVMIKDIPKESFGVSRTVCLPGQTVSVQQILDALKVVGGEEKLALIEEKRDPVIERIVASWPSKLDTSRAFGLGMWKDISLEEIVEIFLRKHVK